MYIVILTKLETHIRILLPKHDVTCCVQLVHPGIWCLLCVSVQVPNLYKPDEFEEVRNALSDEAKKEGIDDTPLAIFQFLLDRVRSNLHIVLGMSPVGEAFRYLTASTRFFNFRLYGFIKILWPKFCKKCDLRNTQKPHSSVSGLRQLHDHWLVRWVAVWGTDRSIREVPAGYEDVQWRRGQYC